MKRVQATQQPLVITQRGRAAAIMPSVEAYERLADTQELFEPSRKRRAGNRRRRGTWPRCGHGVSVRFTPTGRHQFLAALACIRRNNPVAAVRFRQRTEDALRRLEQFPAPGREIRGFPQIAYREIIVPPYRIFHRIQGRTVWVAAGDLFHLVCNRPRPISSHDV